MNTTTTAESTPMMTMTTIASTKVNPRCRPNFMRASLDQRRVARAVAIQPHRLAVLVTDRDRDAQDIGVVRGAAGDAVQALGNDVQRGGVALDVDRVVVHIDQLAA